MAISELKDGWYGKTDSGEVPSFSALHGEALHLSSLGLSFLTFKSQGFSKVTSQFYFSFTMP